MSPRKAEYWIKHFQLIQHVEGGWFSEIYRSSLLFSKECLPLAFAGQRNACTHIYFLLEKKGFSAFHRIQSDELWHFYEGDPLIIYEIEADGQVKQHLLGNDPEKGQSFFHLIKAGNWFGSTVAPGGEYGLAGCTVSPGFDFADFELADKEELLKKYPQHAHLIRRLTL
jgi:uncharacterized protein